jgi:two-component system phosphate regulon sensor histidine kinase PhoR
LISDVGKHRSDDGVDELKLRQIRLWIYAALLSLGMLLNAWALGHVRSNQPGDTVVWLWMEWTACTVSVVCAALLVWHLRKKTFLLQSIAERLQAQGMLENSEPWTGTMEGLSQRIHEGLDRCVQESRRLQAEVEDLQIQALLSQHQKQNVEAIIDSLRDPVLVVDENDRLLIANPAAGALFGFDSRYVDHAALPDIVAPYAEEFVTFLYRSRKNHADATRGQLVIGPSDCPRSFECVVSYVQHETQTAYSLVAVLHDVTREKEVTKIKNDFVSYVSHELKTPLASITAYAEMLLDGEADDEAMRHEFYTIIQGQATRLNRLIDNILNVSRIESGLMRIEKETVSLAILVEEQLQMIRSYAEDHRIHIIGNKPIVYDQVYADRDMMSQVIVNLLSNAIKYNCSEGSVTIETEVDESRAVARVSVKDTGVGIPPDELEHVFDKFYRANSNEDRAEGTGLGLNLVQQIVEKLHGGRVFVKSQLGVGSTFGFELPLATHQTVEMN